MYTVPSRATPTEGSPAPPLAGAGRRRTLKLSPLSSDTISAGTPPQLRSGTCTVPSGATLTWPCSPPRKASQSPTVFSTAGTPNVAPPSSLRMQKATRMDCEQ